MRRNRFVHTTTRSSPPLQRPRGLKRKEARPTADWRLEASIWARRPEVSDSASFYDTDEVMRRALGCDWARAGKERGLFSYIRRKDDGDNGGDSDASTPPSPREGGGDGGVGEGGGDGDGEGGGGGGGGEGEGEGEGEGGGEGEAGEAGLMGAEVVIDHADEEAEARRAAEAAELAAKVEAARALEAGELGEVGEVLSAMGEHAQLVLRGPRALHPNPLPSPSPSPLTTHHSPLTTHHSPVSPLTTQPSP